MICNDWYTVGIVVANASSAQLHRDANAIYRIHTADGKVYAPSYPTMGHAGTLMTRKRVADVHTTSVAGGVRTHPFSGQVGR